MGFKGERRATVLTSKDALADFTIEIRNKNLVFVNKKELKLDLL